MVHTIIENIYKYVNDLHMNNTNDDVNLIDNMDNIDGLTLSEINSVKALLGLTSGYVAPNLGVIYMIISIVVNYDNTNIDNYMSYESYDFEKYYLGGYIVGLFMKIYDIKLIIVGVIMGLFLRNSNLVKEKIDLDKVKNIIVNINNYVFKEKAN